MDTIIIIGGAFNLGFALFHIFFWKLFHWKRDLASLTYVNRSVMQILNLCLTFVFLIFAYISFSHTFELLITPLGKTMLVMISLFWFIRAVEQLIFFGLKNKLSFLFFVLFILGGGIYIYPLIY